MILSARSSIRQSLLFFLTVALCFADAHAADSELEHGLATEVERFVEADRAAPPASCQVLFVGSSSIVKWKDTLATDMAPIAVINRGFGGSHIEYVNRWFDEIVAPYHPRAIVFYAGENDIDVGKSVDRVVSDFDAFMVRKTQALGRTPVYFISIKPSKLRFAQLALQNQVNSAIRARSEQRVDLHFIDVVSPMLENGKPKDIFGPDGLHMTRAGYAIWARIVKEALLPNTDSELAECKKGALSPTLPPQVDTDGTIHVPAFSLPESSLLNEETLVALKTSREDPPFHYQDDCPSMEGADRVQMPAIRRCEAEAFYRSSSYKRLRERYPVVITPQVTGGVYTEVFTPRDGIERKNKNRVLINLRGGHFKGGSRIMSHLESVPIAAIGKIKVVSVDYRMAPEYSFPAASEDVAAVYRELLKTYKPRNIGIYGSSAGGLLTAESIAWFQKMELPLPAAVGMLAGAASYYQEGDSGPLSAAVTGIPLDPAREHPYFKMINPTDPLAFPIHSAQIMAKFPPSLLVATTRDIALSSVVYTHSQLLKLGVEAELHVWEGLAHTAYLVVPDLPQSREVNDVTVQFFDRHLGQ
jgi:epsilon-lactone hydrolase